MANKRNYEWPQASVWDGYFTQDKVGGTTQRVDPSLVFDRLRAEGFMDEDGVDYKISSAVQNLQTQLTFDTTPTTGSTNPVTSGGIKTALNDHVGDNTNPHGVTKSQVGLGNVENHKAVSVVASQELTEAEKIAARGNIDAAKDLAAVTITPAIVDTTATLTIEQGSFASIDLTGETALTAVDVVLTNTAGGAFPLWWFKIKAGSAVTLSVKIGEAAVGWLGTAITSLMSGKTVELSVVDGVACGGELV